LGQSLVLYVGDASITSMSLPPAPFLLQVLLAVFMQHSMYMQDLVPYYNAKRIFHCCESVCSK